MGSVSIFSLYFLKIHYDGKGLGMKYAKAWSLGSVTQHSRNVVFMFVIYPLYSL
jgi:hypothetical protein